MLYVSIGALLPHIMLFENKDIVSQFFLIQISLFNDKEDIQ